MTLDRFPTVSHSFDQFWMVLDRFRIVSDGFGSFSDRFGTFSDVFRPFSDDSVLNLKFQISIGQGWGPSEPFRPSEPSRPQPWPIEI